MSPSHTPTPWGIERTPDTNWIGPLRRSGDGKVEAVVCSTDREGLKPAALRRNDANAALIVRAVNEREELLAACKLAQQFWYSDHPNDTVEGQAAKRLLDDVLAKADTP